MSSGEPGEISLGEPTVDLTKPHERPLGETIRIDGDQIGASKWEEMLRMTQGDGKERSLYVTSYKGKLVNSRISEGTAMESLFGFDLNLPNLFGKRLTYVHTHPQERDLPNSVFSDPDIQYFNNSSLNAFLMIEGGGAHLLIKTLRRYASEEIEIPRNFRKKREREIGRTTELVADLIRLTASDLEQYGIGYYFCPDISSAPGARTFQRAKAYFAKPETPNLSS